MAGEQPADWEPVKREYEESWGTLDEIARRHGITVDALRWRAKKGGWLKLTRRRDASGPALLSRVYRLLERQIFHMEQRPEPMNDKDAAALTRVAATLERLMAVKRLERKPARAKRPSKDLEALRKKIADRFDELDNE